MVFFIFLIVLFLRVPRLIWVLFTASETLRHWVFVYIGVHVVHKHMFSQNTHISKYNEYLNQKCRHFFIISWLDQNTSNKTETDSQMDLNRLKILQTKKNWKKTMAKHVIANVLTSILYNKILQLNRKRKTLRYHNL